ncbi:hypothetical protein SAMN04488598_12532 [Halanaerobium congolense]|jgi:hypothetical protein|uniref:Uncharacterized protein n=1 Tax=Halanaerobium congolense TaxID=54121 RepID=A0A1I0BU71_9FIRM|nr:hypothetical protein [Halanaerobium congolense]PTX15427.1 hypothetical protein C7953_0062 [Halanaerobium congolense]TDP15589.1 hypothetical protein C8C79_11931 [Halanaerobium congolense]SDF80981.1 hypothetical protein SAMN04488598_12532 [Halanaerobium congolense]SET09990.1 hypothetical protein SAMN04515652_12532 [Halanaerobium congolense]SFP51609.1 hypothetical protein SAMN04488596_1255 [Halanaerobium congolense]
MRLKIILIIFAIIFLFQGIVGAAGVYLGSFAPQNDDSFSFSVSLPELEGDIISIYTVDEYFRSDNKKINSANLKLITQEGIIPLTSSQVNLEKDLLSKNQTLSFQFDLQSKYEPGLYKNILYLESSNFKSDLEIIFEIRPWMEILDGSNYKAIIDQQTLNHKELISSGQQKLIIRSNTDWKLKVLISEDTTDNLAIRIGTDSESRKVVDYQQEFVNLSAAQSVIASGMRTTDLSSGRAEIYYQLKIDDFKKITAGEKSYQLNFMLEKGS